MSVKVVFTPNESGMLIDLIKAEKARLMEQRHNCLNIGIEFKEDVFNARLKALDDLWFKLWEGNA